MISTADDEIRRIVDGFPARRDDLIERVLAWTRTVPGYAAVPAEALRVGYGEAFDVIMRALTGDVTDTDLQRWAGGLIATRVHFGIPLEMQVRATLAAAREVFAAAGQIAEENGIGAATLATVGCRIYDISDVVVAEVSARAGAAGASRQDRFVYDVLHGTAAPDALANHNVYADRRYVAFRIRAATDSATAQAGGMIGSEFTTTIAGDLAGFTERIPDLPAGIDATIGVGPPCAPAALSSSFELASRAVESASVLGRTGVHSLPELGVSAAVVDDDPVGDGLVARYLRPLLPLGSFGESLRDTLVAFFDNGMRMDATAAALHVHPNTLRNRFRRYEEITGADLDAAEDLVGVWWALKRTALSANPVLGTSTHAERGSA